MLPCRADDPDNRARLDRLVTWHAHAIFDTLDELASLGLICQATVRIRAHSCPPLFKMYILNGEDMFFGLYPIIKHTATMPSGPRDIYDLMGKDSVGIHHTQCTVAMDHPGKVGGSDTWEDSESWQHRRSTPTSCVNAR